MSDAPEQNYWRELSADLKERILTPFKHPTFIMYFGGIIVVVGSFGLLESVLRWLVLWLTQDQLAWEEFWRSLVRATYAYFVAIAATAAVDFVLSYHRRKFLLMFFMLCSLAVFLCAILAAILAIFLPNPILAMFPSAIGYILALLLWWVANAKNSALLDTPAKEDETTGGDPQAELSGDLSEYQA